MHNRTVEQARDRLRFACHPLGDPDSCIAHHGHNDHVTWSF